MKWYYVAFFALVSMIAGFFIYPVLRPCEIVMPPETPTVIEHGPVKPDTVVIDRYITEEVPVYVTKWKDREVEIIVVDTVYIEKQVPIYRSMEVFGEEYYSSTILAWARCPVDSFYNKVSIDYNRYFYDVYYDKIRQERNKYRWYDLGIGFGIGASATLLGIVLISN